jgi:dynein light chain roadblock-type
MSAETEPSSPSRKQPAHGKSTVVLQEVQETISRIAAHKGVSAVLILNSNGDIVTKSGKDAVGNAKLLKMTLDAAQTFANSIPKGEGEEEENSSDAIEEIQFLRMRTGKEEILVAPKSSYVMVVFQDPAISTL